MNMIELYIIIVLLAGVLGHAIGFHSGVKSTKEKPKKEFK